MKNINQKSLRIFIIPMICYLAISSISCGGLSTIKVETPREIGGHRVVGGTLSLLNNSITSPEMEEAFKKYLASNPQMYQGANQSEIGTRAGFMRTEDGQRIWH